MELGSGVPLAMVLSWFVSNSAEALIGAAGVRRFNDRPAQFDSFRRSGCSWCSRRSSRRFCSSFLDAAFVQWNGWGTDSYWQVWRVRFFSNVLAILTTGAGDRHVGQSEAAVASRDQARRALERACSSAARLSTMVFARPALGGPRKAGAAVCAVAISPVGRRPIRAGGASASLLVFALLSVWGAIHGRGPFVGRSMGDNVLSLQLFLIVTYIPLFALTAAIRECGRARGKARRSEERLTLSLGAAQVGAWDWNIAAAIRRAPEA